MLDECFKETPIPRLVINAAALRTPNLVIPEWLRKARPDQLILIRQSMVPLQTNDFAEAEASLRKLDVIEYDVSEQMGYWP